QEKEAGRKAKRHTIIFVACCSVAWLSIVILSYYILN
ncbi:unnamed protein product, partial [marine sediment metagenome]